MRKTFRDYLNESTAPRECACFMVEFKAHSRQRIFDLIDMIPDEYVYDESEKYGKEEIPHITIRYGVNLRDFNDFPDIAFKMPAPFSPVIAGPHIFEADDYDVLVLNLKETPQTLLKWREYIEMRFDCDESTYPEYIPHITLAYMKKGYAKKFIDEMDEAVWLSKQPLTVENEFVTVSLGDMTKLNIPLVG